MTPACSTRSRLLPRLFVQSTLIPRCSLLTCSLPPSPVSAQLLLPLPTCPSSILLQVRSAVASTATRSSSSIAGSRERRRRWPKQSKRTKRGRKKGRRGRRRNDNQRQWQQSQSRPTQHKGRSSSHQQPLPLLVQLLLPHSLNPLSPCQLILPSPTHVS